MRETKLWNVLTAHGTKAPYGMTESLETEGKVPEGSVSAKISDSLYLVKTGEGVMVYDREEGQLRKPESFPATEEADGFGREISLATDLILYAEFSDGKLTVSGTEFPVTVRKVAEKMLLIEFEEGEVMLFDTSRFLLYAFAGEKFICGYAEV